MLSRFPFVKPSAASSGSEAPDSQTQVSVDRNLDTIPTAEDAPDLRDRLVEQIVRMFCTKFPTKDQCSRSGF